MPHSPFSPLLIGSGIAHHVQQQRFRRQIHAVIRSRNRGCNLLRGLPLIRPVRSHINATQLDESRIVLHGLSDQLRRSGFSFSVNNRGFLVLLRLLHHVFRALRFLLRCTSRGSTAPTDLLGLDGVRELTAESQVDNGHIVDDDAELAASLDQVALD